MEKEYININKSQIKILEKIINDSQISFEELITELEKRYYKKLNQQIKLRDVKIKNALSIIGKYKSRETDISINHDKYLSEDFK
jgi:hypothetical protein